MTCCWAVLEESGEGSYDGGGWGAWLLEVWGEKVIDRGACGGLVGEKWWSLGEELLSGAVGWGAVGGLVVG